MENIKKEEKKVDVTKENKKSIIIVAVIAVVVLLLVAVVYKNFVGANTVSTKTVQESIKDKKTLVIFATNSDSKKCEKCSTIKKHLDSKKISYELYDVNNVSDKEYKSFLSTLNIDSELFGYPAVIYIKDGVMYSNIINIDDTKVVDQFAKDYDLAKIK